MIVSETPDAIWARPKGTRRVQLQRHLVAHFLREELGYQQTEIAGALGKHRATIGHSHLLVWRMREESRVDALMARVRAVWLDPARDHAKEFARRATAFDRVFEQLADGQLRQREEDLAVCLAAAADAAPIRDASGAVELKPPEKKRAASAAPAVPLHPVEAILGHAPAIRGLIGQPGFEHVETRAGGIRLSLFAQTAHDRMKGALDTAAAILERAGFTATSEGVFEGATPRGRDEPQTWRGVLRVAPARMLGIAAALGLLFGGGMVPKDLSVGVELEAV